MSVDFDNIVISIQVNINSRIEASMCGLRHDHSLITMNHYQMPMHELYSTTNNDKLNLI